MKMAKIGVLALAFALFASGCGGGGNGGGSGGNEAVTLQFMGWEASPLETEAVKKGLDLFMEKYPNIKVEYQPTPGGAQYAQKLLTMLAGNAAPDVFFLGAAEYRSFQERNVLLDLTPTFEAAMSLDDFIPSSARIMEIDGKIYGVSSCTVSPVLFYNKDLFDKANIPYPPSDPSHAWTWDQFRQAAIDLTVKEGDKVVQYGAFGLENFYMTSAEILSNAGQIFTEDGSKIAVNSPEAKEVMQKVLDLRLEHGASPTAKTLESIGMRANQMLQTGKVAMIIEGSWALQELAAMDFPVGVAPLPVFDVPKTHGQAHVHAAAHNTKHPDEAWKLIEFLSSEEYQIQLIKEGLWMPNRKSLYTEDGIAKWHNESVHPEGFKAMARFFAEADAYPFTLITQNIVNDIITEETDKLWYSGQSVDDTMANIEKRSNAELAK
ncbi:sugar ABC transporter substrate-binding protein [Paenibacillus sp.]|uniref:ABC transporter substrate-binding protein n=1 Tax=Paenibacillus sp. TaxID=58172 RepID=UPI00281171AF|nr:sugar ABC transporter substrate-binding protein [Paenibacillus sp.]